MDTSEIKEINSEDQINLENKTNESKLDISICPKINSNNEIDSVNMSTRIFLPHYCATAVDEFANIIVIPEDELSVEEEEKKIKEEEEEEEEKVEEEEIEINDFSNTEDPRTLKYLLAKKEFNYDQEICKKKTKVGFCRHAWTGCFLEKTPECKFDDIEKLLQPPSGPNNYHFALHGWRKNNEDTDTELLKREMCDSWKEWAAIRYIGSGINKPRFRLP